MMTTPGMTAVDVKLKFQFLLFRTDPECFNDDMMIEEDTR